MSIVIRAIEEARHPFDDISTTTERSRFTCMFCTRELHALMICDGPVCRRCTRIATIQRVLTADEPVPETKSPEVKQAEEIIARHHAQGTFRSKRG